MLLVAGVILSAIWLIAISSIQNVPLRVHLLLPLGLSFLLCHFAHLRGSGAYSEKHDPRYQRKSANLLRRRD